YRKQPWEYGAERPIPGGSRRAIARPRVTRSGAARRPHRSPPEGSDQWYRVVSMISVLIADDHPIVRVGILKALEAQPDLQLCPEASDGEEALGAIERYRPDVVVLDIGMPRLGGLETLRLLRERYPGTRTLLISVRGDPVLVDSAIQLGADGY